MGAVVDKAKHLVRKVFERRNDTSVCTPSFFLDNVRADKKNGCTRKDATIDFCTQNQTSFHKLWNRKLAVHMIHLPTALTELNLKFTIQYAVKRR